MRKYNNGYRDKINYWKSQITIRRENGDVDGVVHALRKMNYFLNRQVEVILRKKYLRNNLEI